MNFWCKLSARFRLFTREWTSSDDICNPSQFSASIRRYSCTFVQIRVNSHFHGINEILVFLDGFTSIIY